MNMLSLTLIITLSAIATTLLAQLQPSASDGLSSSKIFEIIFDLSHITENMHNKIIHFPIACGIITAIFEALDIFIGKFRETILILLGLTSISSALAVISGFSAEKRVIDSVPPTLEPVLSLHEVLGISYAVATSTALILKFVKGMEKVSSAIVIVSASVVAFTGYLGGIIAH